MNISSIVKADNFLGNCNIGNERQYLNTAVLCSNCHRMAHKRKEPYTIEELKEFIKK